MARTSLEPLLIAPSALPAECSLAWHAKPVFFEPTRTHPGDFLGLVIGQFWLPAASGVDRREVTLGVSNVYTSPTVDHAVVSVSIVFGDASMAERARAYLEGAHGDRPGFSVARNETLLWLLAPHASVSRPCAAALRSAISTELDRAL